MNTEQWQKLIELIETADVLQQSLIGDEMPDECYDIHNRLNTIADELADMANEKGIDI